MLENLNLTKGLIFSQELMLELTKTGLSREKSYKMVQSYAKKCFAENLDLFNVIQSDKYIMSKISPKKLSSIFSYSKHFKNVNLISVGIRNISKEEIPFLKKNTNRIKIFWAKDQKKWNLKYFKRLIKNKNVYLTFDVDGLDSSIMPATGTPEPGGLFWYETLSLIKTTFKNANVIGADINELAPIKGFNSYNFLVAKLAYKILTYKFFLK